MSFTYECPKCSGTGRGSGPLGHCEDCKGIGQLDSHKQTTDALTRLSESIGTSEKPNEDYPIYRVYPIVFQDILSVIKRLQELTKAIEPAPCGKWGHLMIHTHLSPSSEFVCDLCNRNIDPVTDYLQPKAVEESKRTSTDKFLEGCAHRLTESESDYYDNRPHLIRLCKRCAMEERAR